VLGSYFVLRSLEKSKRGELLEKVKGK